MESTLDTIEGTIPQDLWFHYDVGNDVLYIRLESNRSIVTASAGAYATQCLTRTNGRFAAVATR